ncbi:MAG: aspartate/glutamate racemase family protein [Proteobacteria bacterium]|nr:aspartate/glutamate racemase family protein [Pseudomonadota bacterium]
MIGVFDSGHGGLTVLAELVRRFPDRSFLYLGDHANAPYGDRSSDEIVTLTRDAVTALFDRGCRLVLLGCNTATCVAARELQRHWLPSSPYAGTHNILGIVAPTVEAATQTPWGVTTPQYPQKYNSDVIAVFGTTRTISSNVFPEEISKRCPKIRVVAEACPDLAGAIEAGRPEAELDRIVARAVESMLAANRREPPHRAILGCTHYPLVEPLFRRHLPPFTRLLSQPEIVADSLEDYLARHPCFAGEQRDASRIQLLTTGDVSAVTRIARIFWAGAPAFQPLASEAMTA